MATDLRNGPEPSVTALVSGIVNDAHELLKQQMALLKAEIREDLRKTKEATISFSMAFGLAMISALLLSLMLPLLLNWALPKLPLWACFGIVGAVFAAIAGAMASAGKRKIQSIKPVPEESVQALKENIS